MENVFICPLPEQVPMVEENNMVANLHDLIHVVRVDDCCYVEFFCNLVNQLVDDE